MGAIVLYNVFWSVANLMQGCLKANAVPALLMASLKYKSFLQRPCGLAYCMQAGGFGPLKDGLTIICSSALARRLLASPPAPVLAALGEALKYEIAIGQNERIWIDALASASTVLIANAIERSEFLREDQVRLLVQKLTSRMEA